MDKLNELRQRKRAGEHLAVLRLASELLQDPQTGLSDREGIEVCRAAVMASWWVSDHYRTREFAQRELVLAQTLEDEAIAEYHLGAAEVAIGDYSQALILLERARLNVPDRLRGDCYFNLGTAYLHMGSHDRAIEALVSGIVAFEAGGNDHGVADSCLQIGWVALLAGRSDMAAQYLDRAGEILAEHPEPQLQTSLLCHRAFYHWRLNEPTESLRLCAEVFQPGRVGVGTRERAEAAWIAGECGLALGTPEHLRHALTMADLAIAEAMQARNTLLMNRGNDLRQRVLRASEQSA